MESLIGQTLGQYQIVEAVGVGGMASVFKAYQPGLDRFVALKILPPLYAQQPGFQERFTREAKSIAKLNHPNILPVYDYGQAGDYSYIVMRYVEAGSLQSILGVPQDLHLTVKIVSQIGMALEAAHQMGIIHRDVKPANVLLDKDDWALLTDFGLARMLEESIQLTGTGVGIGTPAYMSPEQGQGGAVDNRTDIYSLGVVLFQMLTGDIPYKGETPLSIVIKRMTEPLPLPRSVNPDIPEAVERVILKSLAKDPDDRFQSAAEMIQRLESVAQTLTTSALPQSPLAEAELGSDVSPASVRGAKETPVSDARGTNEPSGHDDYEMPPERLVASPPPTVMKPPSKPDRSDSQKKKRALPLWGIGFIALAGVLLLLFSGILALRFLPRMIKNMQTRQAVVSSTVTPATSVVLTPPTSMPVSSLSPEPTAFVSPGDEKTRIGRADLPTGHGAVSGVVRDEHGKLLPDIKIEFLDPQTEKRILGLGSGPEGKYNATLPAGEYVIVFRHSEDPRNLVPQFYDRQNNFLAKDAAEIIEVTEGEELRDVNIALEHGFAVSGRLIDSKGNPIEGKSGALASLEVGVVLAGPLGFASREDGQFRAVAPAGRYLLTFEGPLVRREVFLRKEIQIDDNLDLGNIVYERRFLEDVHQSSPDKPEMSPPLPPLEQDMPEDSLSAGESPFLPPPPRAVRDEEIGLDGHAEIFVVSLENDSIRRQITRTKDPDLPKRDPHVRHIGNLTPAWSPGGDFIVFASNREANDWQDHHSLYIMRADGSEVRRLTHDETNDVFPSWSPDGEKIIYMCDCNICFVRPDGSGRRIITDRGGSCDPLYVQPVWNPGSDRFAVWAEAQQDEPVRLYIGSVDEGVVIDEVAKLPIEQNILELFWSPDGRQLAWLGFRGEAFTIDLETKQIMPSSKEKIGPWGPRVYPQWFKR